MLARLVFSLVLGLLMYVPRPAPRPPIDTVPPTPDTLPPGRDGDGVPPKVDPPGRPIPLPEIRLPRMPKGPHGRHAPSLPPTPPPGHAGEWPPASERPDRPPTPPPGHDGPWSPGNDFSFRERIREIIRELQVLLNQDRPAKAIGDADEGVKKLGPARPAAEGDETLYA